MDDGPHTGTDQTEPPEPPPFDPDPVITYLERGGKPSQREMREIAEQA